MPDNEEAQEEEQGADMEDEGVSQDFSDAFRESMSDAKTEDESAEKADKDAEKDKEEKEDTGDKSKDKDKSEENDEDKSKEKGKEGDKDESDEDARGKEIIEAEEKAKTDEETAAAEIEEKAKKVEAEAEAEKKLSDGSKIDALTNEDATFFSQKLIPNGRIPDTVKIGDVEVDLKGYMDDNPEIALIASIATQEMLVNLTDRGSLNTGKQIQAMVSNVTNSLMDEVFGLGIIVELMGMGHAGLNLEKIYESKEYNEWGEKQSKATKALFRSNNPADYARGVAKYLKDAGLKGTKEKAAEIDSEAKKKKDDHVALHKSTMDSSKSRNDEIAAEGSAAEYRDGFLEAARKQEKEP